MTQSRHIEMEISRIKQLKTFCLEFPEVFVKHNLLVMMVMINI